MDGKRRTAESLGSIQSIRFEKGGHHSVHRWQSGAGQGRFKCARTLVTRRVGSCGDEFAPNTGVGHRSLTKCRGGYGFGGCTRCAVVSPTIHSADFSCCVTRSICPKRIEGRRPTPRGERTTSEKLRKVRTILSNAKSDHEGTAVFTVRRGRYQGQVGYPFNCALSSCILILLERFNLSVFSGKFLK